MGHKHSKPEHTKCNYSDYENKIQKITKKYDLEKSKNNLLQKKIQDSVKELENNTSNYDKLRSICMVKDNDSIQETGQKIYKLLSKKYKENIDLMDTQDNLINKQNSLIDTKEEIYINMDKKFRIGTDDSKKLKEEIQKTNKPFIKKKIIHWFYDN